MNIETIDLAIYAIISVAFAAGLLIGLIWGSKINKVD